MSEKRTYFKMRKKERETTIKIDEEVWKFLKKRGHLGESFSDTLRRFIKGNDET